MTWLGFRADAPDGTMAPWKVIKTNTTLAVLGERVSDWIHHVLDTGVSLHNDAVADLMAIPFRDLAFTDWAHLTGNSGFPEEILLRGTAARADEELNLYQASVPVASDPGLAVDFYLQQLLLCQSRTWSGALPVPATVQDSVTFSYFRANPGVYIQNLDITPDGGLTWGLSLRPLP
jgi:hypothetical protein